MANRYFDPQLGSESNSGLSPLYPKKNPPALSNGDRLLQRRGSVYVRNAQWGFGLASDIEITGYGDVSWGKPIVEIASTSFNSIAVQGDRTVFRGLTFRDFKDSNAVPSPNRPNGIAFVSKGTYDTDPAPDKGEIYDCDFYRIPGDAVAFNGFNSSAFNALGTSTGIIKHCVFDEIGGDAVFAKVRTYFEVSYCRMTRLSMQNLTGDGIGFLDCNPVLAWVHHNYIDHREVDSKQCIIIDGLDGSGLAVVEDNVLLGFGDETYSPTLHVNLNVDQCKAIVRRNKIVTSGIGVTVNADGPLINSNLIMARRHATDGSGTVVMLVSNGRLLGNTIINTGKNAGYTLKTGSGRSGNVIKNNAVIGGDVFFKQASGSTSANGNNLFFGVANPYVDSADATLALAGTDIVADPLLNEFYRPTANSPLIGAGAPLDTYPLLDAAGNPFFRVPTIGAFEYQRPRAVRRLP